MARAGRYSFIIEQGATFTKRIRYLGGDGLPINLTNYNARMHIRQSYDSNVTIVRLTNTIGSDGSGIVITAVSGTLDITLSAASSSNLSFTGEAYYDLEIYSGSGSPTNVKRLLEGKVKLSREVTR